MSLDFGQINIWAILVSAVAAFFVGGLWYGAIFAKQWVALGGFSEEQLQQMEKVQLRSFGIFFVGDLLMATVLSVLIANLGIASAGSGAGFGMLIWLGIAATIGASKNAANLKPMASYLIDTSHELASLVVMGTIIGAWR